MIPLEKTEISTEFDPTDLKNVNNSLDSQMLIFNYLQ